MNLSISEEKSQFLEKSLLISKENKRLFEKICEFLREFCDFLRKNLRFLEENFNILRSFYEKFKNF